MRKKRIMIIGPRNCGKTSLANLLNRWEGPLKKRQDIIFGQNTIDVPSAYLENAWMYMHVIALEQDACCVLMMVDAEGSCQVYSPGFARVFRCPVLGVINKLDLSTNVGKCSEQQLRDAGVREPFFHISVKTGQGVPQLKKWLQDAGLLHPFTP